MSPAVTDMWPAATPGRTRVKICGLTRPEDAAAAARLGADAVGVVFAPSPRQVDLRRAAEVLGAVPPHVTRVGVFTDPTAAFVHQAVAACGLGCVQIHGMAPVAPELFSRVHLVRAIGVITARSVREAAELEAAAFLLDAPPLDHRMGGTGLPFDWSLAVDLPWPRDRVIVAGGLAPANVGEAIRRFRPGGVDVSSGVESGPGIKDAGLIEAFLRAAEGADRDLDKTVHQRGEEHP